VIPSSQSVNEESSTVHTLNPSIEAIVDAEILRVYEDIVKDYPDLIIETGRTETTISYNFTSWFHSPSDYVGRWWSEIIEIKKHWGLEVQY